MPSVELVYEASCPNIGLARAQLLRAFDTLGMTPRWVEWEINTPGTPARVRSYGSPTILVDGRDVAGAVSPAAAPCCRVYADNSGKIPLGAPPVRIIADALKGSATGLPPAASPWSRNLAVLPPIGAALLPKLTCPACWPAYAGMLSSIGVGFVDYTPYLFPLTVLFLVIALAALAAGARSRRGFGPLGLGLMAAAVLLLGKFFLDEEWIMYVALTLLVAASVWNSWPLSTRGHTPMCPTCLPGRDVEHEAQPE